MKIRTGFVSNSSSSSFIISSDALEVPTITIEARVDTLENAKCIETEYELKEFFIERYYLKYNMKNGSSFEEALEIENIAKMYNYSLDKIKEGKVIWCFDACSDGDDDIGRTLYNNGLPRSNKYEIICGE